MTEKRTSPAVETAGLVSTEVADHIGGISTVSMR